MKTIVLAILILSPSVWAQKVLFEEAGKRTFFSEESVATGQNYDEYDDVLQFRSKRRVGVGFAAAGNTGLAGFLLELNYTPSNSAVVSFGGAPKYNTLSFLWKHVFGGTTLAPYTTAGYSRWYSSNDKQGSVGTTTPSFFADKFLTGGERDSGIFGKDIMNLGFGLQFNQLWGTAVGFSFFAEVDMLVSLASFENVPTGSLGMIYYF